MDEEPQLVVRVLAAERLMVTTWWNFCHVRSPFARFYLVHDGDAELRTKHGLHHLRRGSLALVAAGITCDYRCHRWMDHSYCCAVLCGPAGLDPWSLLPHHVLVPAQPGDQRLFARLATLAGPLLRYTPGCDLPEQGVRGPAAAVEAAGLVRMLLARFLTESSTSVGPATTCFAPVIEALNQRLADPPNLGELAALAGLRQSWFSERFRSTFGLPPMRWLLRRRLEVAELRLVSEDVSVKRLAFELGFASSAHFVRTFQRHIGVPPGRYRELQHRLTATH